MNVDPKKAFFRDLKKIADPLLNRDVKRVIEVVKKAKKIFIRASPQNKNI